MYIEFAVSFQLSMKARLSLQEVSSFLSLCRILIIFNEEFDASVVTDYKARLIGLIHADQKFKLINGNAGQHSSNYFSKPEYDQMFEELWEELRSLELADETIAELESSALFRYSPYKTLSPDQEIAFEKIYQSIAAGVETSDLIVIEVMPGTGKTILALYIGCSLHLEAELLVHSSPNLGSGELQEG